MRAPMTENNITDATRYHDRGKTLSADKIQCGELQSISLSSAVHITMRARTKERSSASDPGLYNQNKSGPPLPAWLLRGAGRHNPTK